ncbi:MAG: hypothetical protein JSR99_18695 [Proteobacteria bacterium]|nr:hypothetical protein [Pseudomonadota bacterium]
MNEDSGKDKSERDGRVAVPEVLRTVSDEVRMLSDAAGDLQNLIGNLVVAGAFDGSQSIYELQNLDRLCQNLGAVADFLCGLAKGASPDWKVDVTAASEVVKLADLCGRLTGQKTEVDDATGEFEDFGNWPMTG